MEEDEEPHNAIYRALEESEGGKGPKS